MVWDTSTPPTLAAFRGALCACPTWAQAINRPTLEPSRVHFPVGNPDGLITGIPDPKPFCVLAEMGKGWQRYAEGAAGILQGIIQATFYLPAARNTVDAPTRIITGTATINSPILSALTSTDGLRAGMEVQATSLTIGTVPTVIVSVDSLSQVTLSANANATMSDSFSFLGAIYTAAQSEAFADEIIAQLMPQSTALVWRGLMEHGMASDPSAGERTQDNSIHRTITITAPYGLNA